MISVVTAKTVAGATVALRLTTAAIVRVERHFDDSIFVILDEKKSRMSVEKAAVILGAASGDGAGCDLDAAFALVDDLGGFVPAAEIMAKVLEAAFPDPAGDLDGSVDPVEVAEPVGKPKKLAG